MTGDGGDFEAFYRDHYRRVVLSLRVAAGSGPDAEDLAQEAFARTLARWAKVRGGSNPAGYVYRVAFRLQSRRTRRLWHHRRALDAEPRDRRSTAPELWGEVAALRGALARLPPACRRAAALCLLAEMTATEAAAVLGVSASTVRTQLQRAREVLVAAIADDPEPVAADPAR